MGGRKRIGSTRSDRRMFDNVVGILMVIALVLSWRTSWLSISQAIIVPPAITVLVAMIVVMFRGGRRAIGIRSFVCIIILLTLILMGSMVWHWPLFILLILVIVDDTVFSVAMGWIHDSGTKDDASR